MSSQALICALCPYFLDRDNFWFEKNLKKIVEARKTQPFFEENTLVLEKSQVFKISQLLRKLDELGYEKVLKVQEPGEFSQQGGMVEVFPINLNYALRIEFWGNQIAQIEKTEIEIKKEQEFKQRLKRKLKRQKIYSDLSGIKPGDYLVHLDHGVGIFKKEIFLDKEQYYLIEYANNDKLYVPKKLQRKLSRYIGFVQPKISRLSSPLWQKTKRKIKEEAEKLARELLFLYAKRETATRPGYLPDTEIDKQIALTFEYELTPDQEQAWQEIKKDLEKSGRPMDRILCGDVGFGKTEIALRAAAKVVNSGYQAVLICPTTILANQHYQTFKKRLKNLPIEVALLSRLQPKAEQKRIIQKLKRKEIDILIGTHRILSSDVEFSRLGLLIVDDEQRFGVRQKEKLKKLKENLDILSLSATPIPRTLYLALSALKTISLIQTPPAGRLPIKTFLLPFLEKNIKRAIENEIKRGGQVYYLHNRIETIEAAKNFLKNLVPRAKIGIAHGKLKEKELIQVMNDFQNKKIDVLVATTIIENGLDFPRVNTLIVADSTKLGLSQAYQIRGRIGRSHLQAYAYFLYGKNLSGLAKIRLEALKQAKELGSGYKIALKDLEIRGAGNILGKEQSGNINQVGLNLYCQMLAEAIEKMKRSQT